MQQLVDSGQSKDVTIRYNTNLSRTKYKNYDLNLNTFMGSFVVIVRIPFKSQI